MPRLRARLPARATVARQIAGYWSGDHRSRRGDEDVQHCYSHSWRIALLERFWQARHPPRYAAYLTPSSPRFRLSSSQATEGRMGLSKAPTRSPAVLVARSEMAAGCAVWMSGQNANRCANFVSVGTRFLGLFWPK